jgi:hypothetical protein
MVRLKLYERRVAMLLTTLVKKHLTREVRKILRQAVPLVFQDPVNHGALAKCITELLPGDLLSQGRPLAVSQLAAQTVRAWVNRLQVHPNWLPQAVGREVAQELLPKAFVLDAEFRMPPVRREPAAKKARPLTLVQRRAVNAAGKLEQWERRAAAAKRKVTTYRKKVAYYRKKGAIQ